MYISGTSSAIARRENDPLSAASRELFIGLDLGTSGAKGIVVDDRGQIVASATRDYPLLLPRPGWTEQDPDAWWQAAIGILRELTAAIPSPPRAMGLTGQMHGAVFLDQSDRVIRPAILWNDQRTARECEAIDARVGTQRIRRITGNPTLTGFQAPKVLWLREHEPENHARLARLLLPKDYLRLKLTGVAATDVSDAAGTLLLDLQRRDWSEELLEALDVPRQWLPDVLESPAVSAHISPEAAAETGLPAGMPVVAGAGDNAAAAVGAGIIRPGSALVSIGTSGVVFAHSDAAAPDPTGELHCFGHAVPGAYHLMGVSLSAGASLTWFNEQLGSEESAVADRMGIRPFDLLTGEADTVPAGSDGLFFLPYLAGERTPHMDPQARGAWVGLTLKHGRAHMVRAVLEGVAYALRDSLVRIERRGIVPERLLLAGGGAHSAIWRRIIGAVLDKPYAVQQGVGGPAFGAALLASVGAGRFDDVGQAADAMLASPDVFETPDSELAAAYRAGYERFTRIYPALRAAALID